MQYSNQLCVSLLVTLTASTGCGSRFDRADISVTTKGTPLIPGFGNVTANTPPTAPTPATPALPSTAPSPSAGAVTPVSPSPAPGPTAPVVISPSLSAQMGLVVGTNALTMVFGTSPTYSAVKIRRVAGTVAPDCSTGTVVKGYDPPFAASDTFADQTGTAAATYSYRACFLDSLGMATAGGDQPSAVTKPHILFVSTSTLSGSLGGSAKAADSLCAPFAAASMLTGLRQEGSWQAVVSDSTINASTRIQVLGPIAASDFDRTKPYHTLATSGAQLWSTGLTASSGSILDNSANAVQSLTWTGSDGSGNFVAGNSCSDWSSNSAGADGATGDASTLTGNAWIASGSPNTCDQHRAIYCLSQPTPMLAAVTGATKPNSIDLTINPPAQSMDNASIVIRRKASASGIPSVDCSSALDTPILSVPFGTSPVSYTDDLAASSTPYNYRACLFDENSNLVFSTLVMHVVTSP